jgi:hypothetical protein
MTPTPTLRLGFRVLGPATSRRRLVDFDAALAAYAECDAKAEVYREAYLSAFTFGADFRRHLEDTGSTKDYGGPCGGPFIWWDIDRLDDLERALSDARKLAAAILARFNTLDDDDLLLFYSGSKGFHVGLPTFWAPPPSLTFHRTARRFAETLAAGAGVSIDTGVYDKVRLFRAPNSWHPKTGLHKRRLKLDELLHLDAGGICQLASTPEAFELPAVAATCDRAAADWQAAARVVQAEAEAKEQRCNVMADGTPRLNRATLDFIRDGADQGDRHRLLFSAAANLAEFGCSPALAHALLTEAALDSGLPPADVRRQIECGLQHAGPMPPATPSTPGAPAPSPPIADPSALQKQLAALWDAPPPAAGPYGAEGGRR